MTNVAPRCDHEALRTLYRRMIQRAATPRVLPRAQAPQHGKAAR